MNIYFWLAVLSSLCGPIFYHLIPTGTKISRFVDGMIVTALVCLISLHILPESLEHSGLSTSLAVVLGLVGPVFISRLTKRSECEIQKPFLVISALGFVAHNLLDGAALIIHPSAQSSTHLLALAVIVHRLLVSMAMWKTLSTSFGVLLSILGLFSLNAAMACGFFFGEQIFTRMEADILHFLQSLTCGMLFHILLHPHHLKELLRKARSPRFLIRTQSMGAFCGILLAILAYMFWPAHIHSTTNEGVENNEQTRSK
ncbi:MAG TPA: hypothetical protein VEK06_02770 [Myxococcota bacterium]|nr:hypothetical protein [Myxococcota bacterium]